MAFVVSRSASSQTCQELFGARSLAVAYAWRSMSSVVPLQTGGAAAGWQVSSHGRVCDTRGQASYGHLQPTGYYRVKISGNSFLVHRLVAFAFLGPLPDDLTWQVHHRDGNKANNRLDNLEYVTPSQNIIASYASQTRRCGGIPVMWRAIESQSWNISPSMTQAAAELGMSWPSVCEGVPSRQSSERL